MGKNRSVLKIMGQPLVFHFILFCDFLFFGLIFGGSCIYKAFSSGISNLPSFSITFIIGLGAFSLAFHSMAILLGKVKNPKYLIQSVFASTGLWLTYIYAIKIYAAIRVDNIPYIFESSGYLELTLFIWTMWNIVYFNQKTVEEFMEERYQNGNSRL